MTWRYSSGASAASRAVPTRGSTCAAACSRIAPKPTAPSFPAARASCRSGTSSRPGKRGWARERFRSVRAARGAAARRAALRRMARALRGRWHLLDSDRAEPDLAARGALDHLRAAPATRRSGRAPVARGDARAVSALADRASCLGSGSRRRPSALGADRRGVAHGRGALVCRPGHAQAEERGERPAHSPQACRPDRRRSAAPRDRRAALMDQRVAPGVVGRAIPRSHARRLVAGRGAYADDLRFPRLLHAAFLRSPHARARIARLDFSAASRSDGISAIYDAAALATVCKPWQTKLATWPSHQSPTQPPLASDEARGKGHPGAWVPARSRAAAEDALERIEIEWQPLDVIAHREAALADEKNLAFEHSVSAGKAPAGTSTVRRTVTFARHTGVPLEPRTLVASFDPGERKLTVHQATQVPHQMRAVYADHLGLAEQDVRVITPDIGGGFGVKLHVYDDEMAVVAAAMLAVRPVKYVCDRLEAFVSDIHARAHTVSVSAAVDASGRIHGLELDAIVEAGAYSAYPRSSILEGLQVLLMSGTPYQIDAYQGRLRVAWQNKPATGSYRAAGQPVACAAMETLMDACARQVGIDPTEMRRRNFRREGATPTHVQAGGLSHETCLDRLLELMDYRNLREEQQRARSAGRHLGIGFATFVEQNAPGPAFYGAAGVKISAQEGCTLRLEPSGALTCITSNPDQGQGVETALAQLVAETLRVPFENVRVIGGDTAMTAVGGGTFASRGLTIAGEAVLGAARAMAERIARLREVMKLADAPLEEIAAIMNYRQHLVPPGLDASPAVTTHVVMRVPFLLANGMQASLVEVDVDTGFVKLLKHWVVEDCGQVINPLPAEEQVRGGVVQGIGAALYEECLYDESSQLLNGSLADYLVPMALEMPDIVVAHVETPGAGTALGAKGIGEAGTIGAAAAIGNAINDALTPFGAEVLQQPYTPQRILAALENR